MSAPARCGRCCAPLEDNRCPRCEGRQPYRERLGAELQAYAQQLAGDTKPLDAIAAALALVAELRIALAALRLRVEADALEPADVIPGRRLIAAALKAAYEGGMADGPIREELRDALEGLAGVGA